MVKRILLVIGIHLLLLGVAFGLGLLFFSLGEKESYPLPDDPNQMAAFIDFHLRFGHIIQAQENPDFSYFVNGNYVGYRFIPVSQRILEALNSAFHGDYGQSFDGQDIAWLLLPAFGRGCVELLCLSLGLALGVVSSYFIPGGKGIASLFFLVGSAFFMLFGFLPLSFLYLSFSASCYVVSYALLARYRGYPKEQAITFALALLPFFISWYLVRYLRDDTSCIGLFFNAATQGDNHLLGPAAFFAFLPLLFTLPASWSYGFLRKKKHYLSSLFLRKMPQEALGETNGAD